MPINYKNYHPEWKTKIRPDILKRANNCCESCGIENYAVGYRDSNGKWYYWAAIEDLLENQGIDLFDNELKNNVVRGLVKKATQIILTIAHLDHDIRNNDYSNLKALCQRCHLNHDKKDNWNRRKYGKNLDKIQIPLITI